MCTELNIPLAKSRGDKEAQDLAGHWNEIGTMELGKLYSTQYVTWSLVITTELGKYHGAL